MTAIADSGKLVHIHLDADDFDAIRNDEGLNVECPHTGETIRLGKRSTHTDECECCGNTVTYDITPALRGNIDRLEEGGTAIYDSVHTDEDITIVLRGAYDAVESTGWQ